MKHMAWRIRLGAQDTALSRLRHEFESRMRYHKEEATGFPVASSFLPASATKTLSPGSMERGGSGAPGRIRLPSLPRSHSQPYLAIVNLLKDITPMYTRNFH